jgi:hypothetical protein
VLPGGGGDFPTIQAAVDSASSGDVVELGDGTFRGPGNRDVDFLGKAITIRSESGDPAACVIDCEGSAEDVHRGFLFVTGEGNQSVLEALTITGAHLEISAGSGVYCHGASPTVRDCVFRDNYCFWFGAGIHCANGSPLIEGCLFEDNSAGSAAGVSVGWGSSPTIRGCLFRRNSVRLFGGGARFFDCAALVERCTFVSNDSAFWGGGLASSGSSVTVRSCTFDGNIAVHGSAVYSQAGSAISLERSIVTSGTGGAALDCDETGLADASCSDIWGNAGGDWTGCIADQFGINGNFSADPMFCDPDDDNFMLDVMSPCAPDHNDCGVLIGAYPVGCGASPVEATSWGRVKAMYR